MADETMIALAQQVQAACPTIKQMDYRGGEDGVERFDAIFQATEDTLSLLRVELYSWPDTAENRALARDAKVVAPKSEEQSNASGATPTLKERAKQCKHELEKLGFNCAGGFITTERETHVTLRHASVPTLYCAVIESVQDVPDTPMPRYRLRPNGTA
jgi:hypothetical protein